MFLYERIKDKVIVYDMEPNNTKIKRYRYNALESCDKDLIYKAVATAPVSDQYCFLYQNNVDIIDWEYISNSKHKMIPNNSRETKICVLSNYYNNLLNSYALKRIKIDDEFYGLLFSKLQSNLYPKISKNFLGNDLILSNILLLPNELYILEALKRRQFSLIINDNVNDQLRLYGPLLLIDEISVNDLQRIGKMGLMKTDIDQLMNEIEFTTTLVKKKRRIDKRRTF